MGGFYYSPTYNLLTSREKWMNLDEDEKLQDWANEDNNFYWNYNMYKTINVPSQWRTIWIQGYFFIQEQQLNEDKNIKLGILSRRQYKRGGTRLNARGIDDEGYVGNYIETESFFILDKKL